MTGQYATLIFDLDGTISDPSEGIAASFAYALEAFGFPPVGQADIHAAIGPPLDSTFRKLTGRTDPALIDDLVASYRERYAVKGYAENRLYPGVPEQLKALAEQGVRMGVCTSKRVDFAIKILQMFDLFRYFDFVDGGDTGICKSMQLQSLLQAGEIDQFALMVGDRAIDIDSAAENGLRGAGVLWGFGDRNELSASGPVKILDQVNQLPTLLPLLCISAGAEDGA
jgi:phosphoglycolate phosphatase